MAADTDFYENKLLDWRFRGQALGITGASAAAGTGPTAHYVALFTSAGTDAGPGAEVTGGSYARVAVASSLANWAGTQGAGTTTASTGTSGTTSNNNPIVFAAPTANWGQVVEFALFDSLTGGNELTRAALTTPKTINSGDPAPSFAAGTLSYQMDN